MLITITHFPLRLVTPNTNPCPHSTPTNTITVQPLPKNPTFIRH